MQVLDKGYVFPIDTWGSDERIIEAARMSTGRGFEGWEKDAKLLKFLWDNKHHTPFEMAGLVIQVKAPIMVFREWHRHRVPFSYNEMSARYIPLPDENYVPTLERLKAAAGSNKQAQGVTPLADNDKLKEWLAGLELQYKYCQDTYQWGLGLGIPKEIARLCLPVGRYSVMRASSNLRGWLHFLDLRMAPNAQWEIRQYANAVHAILWGLFPRTMQLFDGCV